MEERKKKGRRREDSQGKDVKREGEKPANERYGKEGLGRGRPVRNQERRRSKGAKER